MLGHDELEHSIAQELEALIIKMMPLRFVAEAGMGQRFRQEKRVAKLMTDTFFERIHQNLAITI